MIAVVFAILNADITTVNVALVTLGKDLHADLAGLQWGLNSYMLAFAALLSPPAVSLMSLDVAVACWPAQSCLPSPRCFAECAHPFDPRPRPGPPGCGWSTDGPRGYGDYLQRLSGEQRALALGTLVGVSGVAQSMGPLLGGFLTAEVSWRWVFLMNLPLIVVIMIVALRSIQESRAENASHRIDIAGVLTLAAALTSLLLGLDAAEGPGKGQVAAFGLIALSLVLFVIFTIVERGTDNAILDGKLLRQPAFLCSCVASFLLGFVFFLFLSLPRSTCRNDLATTPCAPGRSRAAQSRPRPHRRHFRTPDEPVFIAGHAHRELHFSGPGWPFLSWPASSGYLGMVIPFLLVAAGVGPGFTLLNTAGLAAISAERSGQATGMIYMFRFAGGAIGVAAASALHGALFQRELVLRLSATPLSLAQQKILEQPGAAERIGQLDTGLVASQLEQVRQAFHQSFEAAFTGTLRLNIILPIAIAILVIMLMEKKEEVRARRAGILAGNVGMFQPEQISREAATADLSRTCPRFQPCYFACQASPPVRGVARLPDRSEHTPLELRERGPAESSLASDLQ